MRSRWGGLNTVAAAEGGGWRRLPCVSSRYSKGARVGQGLRGHLGASQMPLGSGHATRSMTFFLSFSECCFLSPSRVKQMHELNFLARFCSINSHFNLAPFYIRLNLVFLGLLLLLTFPTNWSLCTVCCIKFTYTYSNKSAYNCCSRFILAVFVVKIFQPPWGFCKEKASQL